ncbi:hypothetical protein B0H10DRAFT_1960179, partial [Mycena sp. CBHHK59/15]
EVTTTAELDNLDALSPPDGGSAQEIGPLLQSVPETEDLADHDEQENGSSAPATMPDAVSSAPTSSESAPPGITVTPNLGAEPTARRSGRKRKEREELKDLSAALSACICGSSAAPLDSSEHPNVVRCRNEGCKLKYDNVLDLLHLTSNLC